MLKNISNIDGVKKIDSKDQKSIRGGFLLPLNDCCVCIFTPAGRPFPVLITQDCATPCPQDGSNESQGTGC